MENHLQFKELSEIEQIDKSLRCWQRKSFYLVER